VTNLNPSEFRVSPDCLARWSKRFGGQEEVCLDGRLPPDQHEAYLLDSGELVVVWELMPTAWLFLRAEPDEWCPASDEFACRAAEDDLTEQSAHLVNGSV